MTDHYNLMSDFKLVPDLTHIYLRIFIKNYVSDDMNLTSDIIFTGVDFHVRFDVKLTRPSIYNVD